MKMIVGSNRNLWLVAIGCLAVACGASSSKPMPPLNLVCTSASRTSIALSWTASPTAGVTGYVLEREPLSGAYAVTQMPAVTSATDTMIGPYSTYVYRVRATSPSGTSDPSNEVTVGPPPPGFNVSVARTSGRT